MGEKCNFPNYEVCSVSLGGGSDLCLQHHLLREPIKGKVNSNKEEPPTEPQLSRWGTDLLDELALFGHRFARVEGL